MANLHTVELPIAGMDCAECTQHVRQAIASVPGVTSVDVLLAAEKAIVRLDPLRVDTSVLHQAVERAGYAVAQTVESPTATLSDQFTRRITMLLAVVFGAVLFIVLAGEGLGVFGAITARVPFVIGLALVLVVGWPIFRNVVRATLQRRVTSHTLMTIGALAALAVGEWVTALIVIFFMHIGEYVEGFTSASARSAIKQLAALAPQTARVERHGTEIEIPVAQVQLGDTVVVRPGEQLPVDGDVIAGQATINQAALTGESMPVDVTAGAHVFAATIAQLGSLRIRTTRVGPDTTFGRVVSMVEAAEANRADVQRFADRFSARYLPVVTGIAAITFLVSRDPLATAAVLVVACSCSIALATPIAMLASIGAAAKRGLLIKGGKHLETLARADVLLIDKTGTLTLGKPQITNIVPLNGLPTADVLALAAAAERHSEHPLAEAVRAAARAQGLPGIDPETFEAIPGMGVRASVSGKQIVIGNQRLIDVTALQPHAAVLEQQGKTLLFVAIDGMPAAVLAATDTVRPDVPEALATIRSLGIHEIEILTGDNELTAATIAQQLGVRYRANLLPEDKIAAVREYQAQGRTVVMVGDGVNDAPALAQADVGIAMGAAGTDIAIEASHVALMRDDWHMVPQLLQISQRTMGIIKLNLGFTALYNVAGLALAAFGILPPVLAAAAQSLPDIGILANSSRLLRQR